MSSVDRSLRISIRADGDERIGAGHVARCLPVARALADLGHRPMFVGSHRGLAAELLAREDFQSTPADRQMPAGVSPTMCEAALVDSYEIPTEEICQLASGMPIATLAEARRCSERGVLVDYHLDRLGEPSTERLLPGPSYAPVDPRFATARRPRQTVQRILLSVGGGTAGEHLLAPAVAAVREVFPTAEVLSSSECEGARRMERTARFWEVMAEVDLAISAAGMTAYELACAGVPAVLVAIAENQRRVARGCAAAGTALDVEYSPGDLAPRLCDRLEELLDPVRRGALAARGPELIDGRGAQRIAVELDRRWRQSANSFDLSGTCRYVADSDATS